MKRSNLSLLLILISFALLLSTAGESAESKPSQNDQTDAKQVKENSQPNSQNPLSSSPQGSTKESSPYAQNFNYSNYNYSRDSSGSGLAAWLQALANIAIAFLVGWQIWFFRGTMQATRDAASAAKDATNIADKTLKTSERAWLSVTFDKPFWPQDGRVNPVMYTVKNVGRSAAFLKVKKLSAMPWHTSVIPERTLDPKPMDAFPTIAVIFPGDVMELEGLIDIDFTGEFFTEMESGHKTFDVYGYIAYDDIFKERHITRFCYVFDPRIQIGGHGFEFLRDPQSEYNDAD
jgi:hypothetical protein